MEDIVKLDLGKEGKLDVDLIDGKLILNLRYDGKEAYASIGAGISLAQLLDKVAEKNDNVIVKGLIGVLKAALGAI